MITIISGSIREGSNALKVARQVEVMYAALGEQAVVLDLRWLPAEAYQPHAYKVKPEALQAGYIDKVLAADGLVVVTPEYNGSFPGVLKHFIDLLPYPQAFECRPVAFIGVAAGAHGGLRAVEQLQMVFAYRNAHLFNRRVFIPSAHTVLDAAGAITDAALAERLQAQAAAFLAFVGAVGGVG